MEFDEQDKNDPIFIVGAPRSGTTLLRYILTSHPNIFIPPESYFLPRFFSFDSQKPLGQKKAFEVVSAIWKYNSFFSDWKGPVPAPDSFVSALPDTRPVTIINTLYTCYAKQYGAMRWGDKTPIYVEKMDKLAVIFPGAKFIHIIRDGRDVALSMRKSYKGLRFFYMDDYYAAATWRDRITNAQEVGSKLGSGRYFQIRYEDLLFSLEENLHKICEFLEEQYHPAMKEPHLTAANFHHSKGIHASTRLPPTSSRIGIWQQEMSPEDQRLFQSVAGETLRQYNYEMVDLRKITLREKLWEISLAMKFIILTASRNAIQKAGIVHPTAILEKITKK